MTQMNEMIIKRKMTELCCIMNIEIVKLKSNDNKTTTETMKGSVAIESVNVGRNFIVYPSSYNNAYYSAWPTIYAPIKWVKWQQNIIWVLITTMFMSFAWYVIHQNAKIQLFQMNLRRTASNSYSTPSDAWTRTALHNSYTDWLAWKDCIARN